MIQTRLCAVLTLGALSTTLAACGGSSSPTLSRAQIDLKANAICRAARKQGKSISQPANFQDAAASAAYFDRVEPITASSTAKLEALKPDSSVQSDWNSFISLRKQGLALLQKIRHKADVKDPSGLQDLQGATPLQDQIKAAATTVGAKACAK